MCPCRWAGSGGKAGLASSLRSSPVIIRVLLPVTALRGDGADDVLSVRTHQLHRMDGQMLVQVCTAFSSIGAQVAFVFSFLWGRRNRKEPQALSKLKSQRLARDYLTLSQKGGFESHFKWGQKEHLGIVNI